MQIQNKPPLDGLVVPSISIDLVSQQQLTEDSLRFPKQVQRLIQKI